MGSGRSIFSYQYLQTGARYDEKCLLIATDRSADDIIAQAEQFHWNFKKMIDDDMLTIHYIDSQKITEEKAIDEIERLRPPSTQ